MVGTSASGRGIFCKEALTELTSAIRVSIYSSVNEFPTKRHEKSSNFLSIRCGVLFWTLRSAFRAGD